MDSETSIGSLAVQSNFPNVRERVLEQVKLHLGIANARSVYK